MTEKIQVVCGHCDSVVRFPADRVGAKPLCPNCHFALFEGKPLTLTAENFDKHTSRGTLPMVVDFWAPWCGPCIAMGPSFEAAARELEPAMRFAKLNTQEQTAPAARLNIRSIPTLIVYLEGKEAVRQSGAMDVGALLRWLRPFVARPSS